MTKKTHCWKVFKIKSLGKRSYQQFFMVKVLFNSLHHWWLISKVLDENCDLILSAYFMCFYAFFQLDHSFFFIGDWYVVKHFKKWCGKEHCFTGWYLECWHSLYLKQDSISWHELQWIIRKGIKHSTHLDDKVGLKILSNGYTSVTKGLPEK